MNTISTEPALRREPKSTIASHSTSDGQDSLQYAKDCMQILMETLWILLWVDERLKEMIPEEARLEFYLQKKSTKWDNQKKNKQKKKSSDNSDMDIDSDNDNKEDAQSRYKGIDADMLWRLKSLEDCKKNIDKLHRKYNWLLGFGKCEAVFMVPLTPKSKVTIEVRQEVEQFLTTSHYALGHFIMTRMGLKEDLSRCKNAIAAHRESFQNYACELEIWLEDRMSTTSTIKSTATASTATEKETSAETGPAPKRQRVK
ncbi:hypothetical protein GQ42DRAFT_157569 [Ramicandelaber brevisporus]|nr:hypothetical protein GQ42DRAFT_157569 [Ramicandelaber brevisporus]